MSVVNPVGEAAPEPMASGGIGIARLAIGLLQGLYLYLLDRAAHELSWPATEPLLFAPLLLVGLLFPVILVASLGHMHFNNASNWAGAVAALAAALGVYDAWRVTDAAVPALAAYAPAGAHAPMPSAPLYLAIAVGVFIAHSLVIGAAQERRRIASYPSYFEAAWKLGVQLAFSVLFAGAVWLALWLGAHLFMLVKLRFLDELLGKSWFTLPVSAVAFSGALHLTDVRPAIVRGIRGLLLTLLSWVLPVMVLIVGGFLLSLPFTGLSPLWATRHAASVLLACAALFVVLVNAAWQDGGAVLARPVRASALAASLLLVPVTAIAAYALGLRVADYGWTPERVIAAACLAVAACYALGYAAAALSGGRFATIARVNIATAFVVLAALLLLHSPAADPARLSVNSQLARLASGKVPVDKFDVDFLHFESARYGREALARLDATASGPEAALLRARIAETRRLKSPWERTEPEVQAQPKLDVMANLRVWPAGTRLPAGIARTDWSTLSRIPASPSCLRTAGKICDAYLIDIDDDRKPELLLVGEENLSGGAVMTEGAHGQWRMLGTLPRWVSGCRAMRKGLLARVVHAVPAAAPDLMLAGQRIHLAPADEIPAECGQQK